MRQAGEIWGIYWADADLHGCTGQFPPDVQASITARWRAAMSSLPPESGVLDLATGRGAVLAHAGACGMEGLRLIGVDRAGIPQREDATFSIIGSVDVSALPFEDRSFALVTSQFGIEYGDLAAALEEAARVANQAVLLLIHASDGIVAQHSAEQADQAEWLLREVDIMGRLRTHFAAPTPMTATSVDSALDAIAKRAERDENIGLLEELWRSAMEMQRMAATEPSAGMIAAVDYAQEQLAGHLERMRALQAAALSADEIAAAAQSLAARGFAVSISEERSGQGALAGRWIDAQRVS